MIAIGLSSGWLHAKNISRDLSQISEQFLAAGATAIEVVIPHFGDQPLSGLISKEFDFTSVHLPAIALDASMQEIERLCSIASHIGAVSSVVHPSCVPEHIRMIFREYKVPIACENMDRTKLFGRSPTDVCNVMIREQIPGVFDFQHAYEYAVDEGREYKNVVSEFIDAMTVSGGITHVHVSGENAQTNHALLQYADNRDEILAAVRTVIDRIAIPIILEGKILCTENPEQMQEEIAKEIHILQNAL
jgi:hypothetical protein